jgi:hypothetical protein
MLKYFEKLQIMKGKTVAVPDHAEMCGTPGSASSQHQPNIPAQ